MSKIKFYRHNEHGTVKVVVKKLDKFGRIDYSGYMEAHLSRQDALEALANLKEVCEANHNLMGESAG